MINCTLKAFHESIEVFLVQKNFMSTVSVAIKLTGAFSKRDVVIITFSPSNIEEISSSSASSDSIRIDTFLPSVVILIHRF